MREIKVELTTDVAWAQARYNRRSDTEVIRMTIQQEGLTLDYEMSVCEAETLAKELLEYARYVKPYEAAAE